jgi:hypothetical protein
MNAIATTLIIAAISLCIFLIADWLPVIRYNKEVEKQLK